MISPYFSPLANKATNSFRLPDDEAATRELLGKLVEDINADKRWLTATVELVGGELCVKLSAKYFDGFAAVLSPCGKVMEHVIFELQGAVEQLAENILEGNRALLGEPRWGKAEDAS
jgi:hypothetical protein